MSLTRWAVTLALTSTCFPGIVLAQASPADLNRLRQMQFCDGIAKREARYACYDKITRQKNPVPEALPPVTEAPEHGKPKQAAKHSVAPSRSFGIETVKTKRPNTPTLPDQTIATVVSATDQGIGHWTITLDSGARWRMTEAASGFAPPRAGQSITIKRGSLGSFLMFVGHQPAVRVERIE
jgi:hypothetical protein